MSFFSLFTAPGPLEDGEWESGRRLAAGQDQPTTTKLVTLGLFNAVYTTLPLTSLAVKIYPKIAYQ